MSKDYSLSEFAARFDFNPEYLRQCCRQQEIGNAKKRADLPVGFEAKKIGGRWRIRAVDPYPWDEEGAFVPAEVACMEGLVMTWHERAMTRYRSILYYDMHEPPRELDTRVLNAIGQVYAESVSYHSIRVELFFDDVGNCKLLIDEPRSIRLLLIDIRYRYASKQLQQIAQHFVSAWYSEFNSIWQGASREDLRHELIFDQISPQYEREFKESCIHCGRSKERTRAARYCTDSCRDKHRKWAKRIADNARETPFPAVSKQLRKVMVEIQKRSEKTGSKTPLLKSAQRR